MTFCLRIGIQYFCKNEHVIYYLKKLKYVLGMKMILGTLQDQKKSWIIIEFFCGNSFDLCCCIENWLLGHFSHLNFGKECKFSFKILKWCKTWNFSEFQKTVYKIVIFWSIHPELNYLYSIERVYHGFSAYLGFQSNLDHFENT